MLCVGRALVDELTADRVSLTTGVEQDKEGSTKLVTRIPVSQVASLTRK